jgi:hypothetical protein
MTILQLLYLTVAESSSSKYACADDIILSNESALGKAIVLCLKYNTSAKEHKGGISLAISFAISLSISLIGSKEFV